MSAGGPRELAELPLTMERQMMQTIQLRLLSMPEMIVELFVVAEAGQLLFGELVYGRERNLAKLRRCQRVKMVRKGSEGSPTYDWCHWASV